MIEPKKMKVHQGESLVVEWHDGRIDTIAANVLRDSCPCASCRNAPYPLPPADPALCRISEISVVGSYAVSIVFRPDGHSTGIYPYPMLRDIADSAS
ncbi:MAG: DUF971 domain-containing protein [Acidimicrobiia bacterium]